MTASLETAIGGLELESVQRISTTDQVLQALRAAIVSGRLAQGTRLREAQLARALGTGRSAVREAVRQLVQEGLVEHEVHRGAFVRVITAADALDIYRAREAVELSALALVLERRDTLDLAPLRQALARLRESAAGGTGTWPEMADVDMAFHEALVRLAGSPRLARMYATLAAESRMQLYQHPPYSSLQNVADHADILDAIERGSETASDLLREHLRYSAQLSAEWLERDGE